jgi:lipid-A-disaccharide synthase-like uncharacterized protein
MNINIGKPLDFWLIFGFIGQICFTMRFAVQWYTTEKKKESVIPISFWFYSIAGSAILLTYAIYRMDPVFIVGQAFGVTVYLRNLHFIYQKKKNEQQFPV